MPQQGVAVAVVQQQAVLLVGYEAAAAPQGPPPHLQDLQRRVPGEHIVLVGPHHAEHNGKGPADDHQAGADGHGMRGNHCAQVNPALDGRRQLRDALQKRVRDKSSGCDAR